MCLGLGGEKMIAELYGKISRRGVNLSDTLEDNLTGNVFGSLRYLPFSRGIKNILQLALNEKELLNEPEKWNSGIEFWPYHSQGEMDMVINLKDITLGIEVKYNSRLSSEDDIYNEEDEHRISVNQLAREARIVKDMAFNKGKIPKLLFLARCSEGRDIIKSVKDRNIIDSDVELLFISWEDICFLLECLLKDNKLNYYESLIIEDIHKLLCKKGFDLFKGFNNIETSQIDGDLYYSFDLEKNTSDDVFGFDTYIKVKEEGYYEFK